MFDRRPEVIVRAEQVADVIAAVNFARDTGVDLSVRGGGHSAPGFGTNDDGVVIDLSLMRHVHVDPRARTARAGGGATWGDFNYATHAYGLATTGRDRLHDRRRRTDPRRRHRLPDPRLRALDRQPDLRRGGHRRRAGPGRQRAREPGPVLGAARGWRQLRRRHLLRVPAAPRQGRLRRALLLRARRRRRPAPVLPGVHQGRPRGLRRLPGVPDRPAAGVHPGGPARRHAVRWPWCTGRGRWTRASAR